MAEECGLCLEEKPTEITPFRSVLIAMCKDCIAELQARKDGDSG